LDNDITASKKVFYAFRAALYDADPPRLASQLEGMLTADCEVLLAHPLGKVVGPESLHRTGYAPLLEAIPDLERRDYIVVGSVDRGEHWICCGGYYTGVFEQPWLAIPPTRHLVTMRYIEFFRIDGGKITKARLLWDIPAVMMQADAWPMAPSLGVELHVPGPATQDGIVAGGSDPARSAASRELVEAMVEGLNRFAEGGAGAMELQRFWHPRMTWYGPAGIGSVRRLSGFRNWHQIPFLNAIPDRSGGTQGGDYDCFFADGDYVAYCGWPALHATVTGDGWMGIAPAGQKISMASLDIWRCENGLLRENWVMIDLLDVWRQLGVDVMGRMKELTFARQPDPFRD
jgi:predicted ester cyclase